MRNHIAVKFLAVVLCAASLLSAAASAYAIYVLVETGLYSKTVDQVIDEQARSVHTRFSNTLALEYAGANLGGCSEDLLQECFTSPESILSDIYDPELFSYTLTDAEGNVLESYNDDLSEVVSTYSYTPSGQYMYLISTEAVGDERSTEAQTEDPTVIDLFGDGPVDVYDIQWVSETSDAGIASQEPLGYLWRGQTVCFQGDAVGLSELVGEVTDAVFLDENGEILYAVHGSESVGFFYADEDGFLCFWSYLTEEGSIYPADRMIDYTVAQAVFYGAEQEELERLNGLTGIGCADFDEDGNLTLWLDVRSNALDQIGQVYGLSLTDLQGQEFYSYTSDQTGPEAGGLIRLEDQTLYFSDLGAVDAAELNISSALIDEAISANEAAWDAAQEQVAAEAEPVSEDAEPAAEYSDEEPVEEAPEEAQDESPEEAPEEAQDADESAQETDEAAYEEDAEASVPEETAAATVPETVPETTAPAETVPEETAAATEPVMVNGKALSEYEINTLTYYDSQTQQTMLARYVYVPMPSYTVELRLAAGALQDEALYTLLRQIYPYRSDLFLLMGISVLLFAIFAVYLCCAAGRTPGSTTVAAGGLNCIPLDFYLVVGGAQAVGIAILLRAHISSVFRESAPLGLLVTVPAAYCVCLIIVGFGFACAAQFKAPNGYWWRHSVCGRVLRWLARAAVWLEKFLALRFFPALWRGLKALWKHGVTAGAACLGFLSGLFKGLFHGIGGGLRRFMALLPLTWQWLLGGFTLIFLIILSVTLDGGRYVLFGLILATGLILYAAGCFGHLLENTRRMSKGDLNTRVDDRMLLGCFSEFAQELNGLADVAVVAAQKQLKSERMKTELITNVSHDIKTPLTSIINYADLLQKPHSDEEEAQYLEVLSRQSLRLKKLIDDLIEMSKASTGNMSVDISRLDAVEAVNQALGEFSDKLDQAQLTPVFRYTQEPIPILADGRLVWRVMSNLLNNAVKYAMPGTRLYVDLAAVEGKAVLSIKNISREELNIDAEELMERFVRGDGSRNTEGSGLGLNIAKSLMELQKGQLQLLVDGDLFKVTLIFPGDEERS